MRVYFVKQYYVAIAILALMACSQNPSPNASPQAKVAHYGTTVLESVTALQRAVTAAAKAEPSFVPASNQITDVIEKIHKSAGQLGDALQAYDAATTLDVRRVTEAQVQAAIAAINALLVEAFNVKIESGVASRIASLIATVAKTVSGLSAELAKFKSDIATPPVTSRLSPQSATSF